MTDGRFTWLDTATVLVSAVILAAAVLVAFKERFDDLLADRDTPMLLLFAGEPND